MRRPDDDLLGTPEHQLYRLTQDELLRLVVICREKARDCKRLGEKAWQELIASDIDRVRGLVSSFRHPLGGRIPRDDFDDVTNDSFERLVKMLGTLHGTSRGEYRAAVRTCVRFACLDAGRRQVARERPVEGSLDEQIVTGEGDKRPRFDDELAKREQRRIEAEQERERDLELQGRIEEAISKLSGKRRRVLELTYAGRSTDEIADELETTADNVYQLRRRGLNDVKDILDGDGGL